MKSSKDSTFPVSGRSQVIRRVMFYSISLLLSLLIIVISVTFFVIVVYLEGRVTEDFFYLFIGVLIINLAISALSIKGMMTLYPMFQPEHTEYRTVFLSKPDEVRPTANSDSMAEMNPEYFTDLELEIIDLLKKNGGKMLQSKIVTTVNVSKASTSRTLAALENKGVIVKVRRGVTNEIILTETYSN